MNFWSHSASGPSLFHSLRSVSLILGTASGSGVGECGRLGIFDEYDGNKLADLWFRAVLKWYSCTMMLYYLSSDDPSHVAPEDFEFVL